MIDNQGLEIIEGIVENVVYKNEETGYTVFELDVKDALITAVGEIGEIYEGESVRLSGKFTNHSVYGSQFRISLCERSIPKKANEIFRYLSSGVIKGVGSKTAAAIVARFGDDTLNIIEKEPERLKSVRGVTLAKAHLIRRELSKIFGVAETMKGLAELSIEAGDAIKIYHKFGSRAVSLIRENPYLICGEDISMPFEKADEISEKLGLSKNSEHRIRAGIIFVISHNIKNGHTYLPKNKLVSITLNFLDVEAEEIEQQIEYLLESNMLISDEVNGREGIFLPLYYMSESYIAKRITQLLQEQTENTENIEKLIEKEEKELKISYARLQKTAIKQALTQNIFILTGGPGTGKTTTLNGMISLFEKRGEKVLLAAPTGRAAQRMSEVTGKEAKTIHRLLEVTYSNNSEIPRFQRNEDNPLKADVVIIDEISMVDVVLFASLLKALPNGARLILVGDSDQLPSVGAGCVLKDLCIDDYVPSVKLSEVFRQAAESMIITNAHLIVKGELPEIHHKSKDFFFLSRESAEKTANTVVDLCARRLPKAYDLSPLLDIQVLCPGRKGELGTGQLNAKLQKALNPPSPNKKEIYYTGVIFREGDRVMQIKNDYELMWVRDNGENGLGVFNGDIGIVVSVDRMSSILRVRYEDREVDYSFDILYELEHAYAITVHKSQGNEYKYVVLPLFNYFEKLYFRNLLYTAVTRAKEMLVLCGNEQALSRMVQNNRKIDRYTALSFFLSRYLKVYEQFGF